MDQVTIKQHLVQIEVTLQNLVITNNPLLIRISYYTESPVITNPTLQRIKHFNNE